MDFHCDGKVNYSEFLAATISTINFNMEEKLWSAFKYFDTTDSGYITLDSVMDALKSINVIIDEEGLKNAFNELQIKGKNINFKEFKAIALGKETVDEEYDLIKEEEQEEKKMLNLNLNRNDEHKNTNKKLETVSEKEEKKESQDIFFEKINFLNLNKDNNNESKENKENNGKDNKNEEENNKKEDNNRNENSNLNSNGNSNSNINNSNHKSNSKNNSKSNNNKSSKSNNKSSKSNNKSSKSKYNNSKSNNKSSKSNKSNMDVLYEEQSIIDDNNDKFTEVNEGQN